MIRKGAQSTNKPTKLRMLVTLTTIEFKDLRGKIATCLPGRFPTQHQVKEMHDFDSNSINNAVGIKPERKNYQSKYITNCMRT